MPLKKRRINTGLLLLLLFVIEAVVWFKLLDVDHYSLSDNATKISLFPECVSKINGYDLNGNSFAATDDDPQIYFSFATQKVSSVSVELKKELESDVRIQLFYPDSNGAFLENRSVVFIANGNSKNIIIPIKPGEYNALRMDFDGSFTVNDISISKASAKANYVFTKRVIAQLLLFYIVTVIVVGVFYLNAQKNLNDADPISEKIRIAISKNLPYEKLTGYEVLFLITCFAFYFCWSLVFLKPTYGPDEMMRYDVPLFIFRNNALPFGGEQELIHPYWGTSYGFSITFPYLLNVFFMKLISIFTLNADAIWVAARFTSVISGVGIAYYSICITKRITKSHMRWLFIIPMALTPQVVFLSSYVNLDSFSLFTVVFLIYTWVYGVEKKWDVRSCIWLGIGLGLCLISYQFAYPFVLGSFILYCLWHIVNRRDYGFKRFFLHGLIVLLVVFLISGWYFIRNAYLYNGDIFALNASKPYAELYAAAEQKPSLKQTYMIRGYSPIGMLRTTNWLEMTFKSIFYVLGGMNWFAPDIVYMCLKAAIVVGLLGCIYGVFSKRIRMGNNYRLISLCLIISSALVFGLSLYYSWASDYQPQGRYIITMLPFIFSFIGYGIYCLLKLFKFKSEYVQKCIVGVLFIAFIILNITATFNCLCHCIY